MFSVNNLAAMAQSVEHLICNQAVAGSSPAGGSGQCPGTALTVLGRILSGGVLASLIEGQTVEASCCPRDPVNLDAGTGSLF